MSLVLRKKENQTWLEAALEAAGYYGLKEEITTMYQKGIESGLSEEWAAWEAAYEWDVLTFVDEP